MGVGAGFCMYDVVVEKVHICYLISWWVLDARASKLFYTVGHKKEPT